MQDILVIRFGALGDLCLLGWTLSRLAAAPGRDHRRVTLVTKARLAHLAARLDGVDRVISLAEPGRLGDLARLARELRATPWDLVLDAHRVLRSRLLARLMNRRCDAALSKDTVARLKLLRGGGASPNLSRHMRDRLDLVCDQAGLPAGEASPPLAHLASTTPDPPVLGLAPGAQWDAKRWPDAHWAALVRLHRTVSNDPIHVFLGPREKTWFAGSELEGVLDETTGVTIIRDRPLVDVATALGECHRLVCNDSGLMHLAEAVGTPVLAFFGPTVAAFGYTPQLPASKVLEDPQLDCRPCSRNGKRPCHRGDLVCLAGLTPEHVYRTLAKES